LIEINPIEQDKWTELGQPNSGFDPRTVWHGTELLQRICSKSTI